MVRLDVELVRRGLARSRGEARDLVRDGHVLVDGLPPRKPAQEVDAETGLEVSSGAPRVVGRAAHKLAAAFATWGPHGLTATGRRCVDVGASTGGFTQVLLAEGAEQVVAVDVGHGQLVPELAEDPRVQERSGTTVRGLRSEDLGGPARLVVADLSFISLTLVAADLVGLLEDGGDLVVLVKPQFEVGRDRLGRGGLVPDPALRAGAVRDVARSLAAAGAGVRDVVPSPISGTTGNAEYLMWAVSGGSATMTEDEIAAAARAVADDPPGG
ncbi:TlyA family RNA methyltransferase [Phycicoccus sp. BSK3Z-2]|uniref:TlyA family RNA methyltransferase n=1 Tax=Phycicoccus avicenniae TaxID=2828860 RepID=A0A941HXQ1_9MICO|nr:TlyA family RNA methyltransferase [Phycicoccus avicenniae]